MEGSADPIECLVVCRYGAVLQAAEIALRAGLTDDLLVQSQTVGRGSATRPQYRLQLDGTGAIRHLFRGFDLVTRRSRPLLDALKECVERIFAVVAVAARADIGIGFVDGGT